MNSVSSDCISMSCPIVILQRDDRFSSPTPVESTDCRLWIMLEQTSRLVSLSMAIVMVIGSVSVT